MARSKRSLRKQSNRRRSGARAIQKRQNRFSSDLQLERLEDRRVLAPMLVGINANDGTLLENGDVRNEAPQELTFNFNPGEVIDPGSLDGITVTRAGLDGGFADGNDVPITPGFVGIGDLPNQVIVRFAENLPDDLYRIQVEIGEPATVDFELDLGAQVVAVVPQPVTRVGNTLTQARNQIMVYFNDDDLSVSSAENREFYQLIFTGHSDQFDGVFQTVDNVDDVVVLPDSVDYNAATDTATLTFGADLDQLATGPGSYRLRIGTDEAPPVVPNSFAPDTDAGSSFDTASTELGTLTNQSQIIFETVDSVDISFLFPGSNRDPGHREISTAFDQHVRDPSGDIDDSLGRIPNLAYNFQSIYGTTPSGATLINTISEVQKQRAREIFELYGHYLGVEFLETEAEGWTIATGDVRAVDPFGFTDPEIVPGIAGSNDLTDRGVAVMNAGVTWNDEYGANWFREGMRQIGTLIGLGRADDLPEGTVMGGDPELTFGAEPEAIFPGDHDIVHGQFVYNPEGNDIDLYQFVVPESGEFTAEIAAERFSDVPPGDEFSASPLDSVLRLFQMTNEGPVVIAQNDNYFGRDSFVRLDLDPGTYYIGVSSTGNDAYSATLEDSGTGGTSEGFYELRVDYRPNSDSGIRDKTGQLLDGDADGDAGGVYDFWFRAQTTDNTLFVDKATTSPGAGSITSPYVSIMAAMNDADVGDVVRVIGNNLGSPDDVEPYQIGFNNLNQSLPDGGTDGLLRVKRGVTLMVDAGAVFKMQRGAILVGTTSPGSDRSGGAVQILGTPDDAVIFTAYDDSSVAGTVELQASPARGDWGGILLQNNFDDAEQRFNYEDQGIFMNYVNHADMRFGGGVITLNSISDPVNPITMIDARPTLTFNTITDSADAAMSASPDSFAETTFHEPFYQGVLFTSDFSRIGPEIHGNWITDNSTNGLAVGNRFVSLATPAVMTIPGRWNDTDIVHVVQEGITIQGNPGGPLGLDPTEIDGQLFARFVGRPDARLSIDPGTVVKLENAQFEVGMGAAFYAEGTSSRRIVMTSLLDDRFGFGGTFDTNNVATEASPGDWAGVFLGPTSSGSFDNAVIAFGGGEAPITGTVTQFNPIEIHQARTRITNSRFESNDSGLGGAAEANRLGRGTNDAATIFIAGAQPIVHNNEFRDNAGSAISVNVNSLNHYSVFDVGRSTGESNQIPGFRDNQGPLVRDNRISGSDINGMTVRGGTLTTESVWDDVDVTHVVGDGIFVPNFHSFGGLTLKSSPQQSLVVKLHGDQAGFVVTGSARGIQDHIGGAINVIGQPGQPVVLTSLYDDSVGAGFDIDNQTQTDTDGGQRPARTTPVTEDGFVIDINFGPQIQAEPEAMEAVLLAASFWEAQFEDNATIVIDVELNDFNTPWFPTPTSDIRDQADQTQLFTTTPEFTTVAYSGVRSALVGDAGAHESLLADLPTSNELNIEFPTDITVPFEFSDEVVLTSANARALGLSTGTLPNSVYDSDERRDGTILINDTLEFFDFDRRDGLSTYREDLTSQMLREFGQVLGFTSNMDLVWAFLQNPPTPNPADPTETISIDVSPLDLFRFAPGEANDDFTGAPRLLDPTQSDHVFFAGGTQDFTNWPFQDIDVGEIPLSTGFGFGRAVAGREPNDRFGAGAWRDEVFDRNGKLDVFEPIGALDPVSMLRDEIFWEIDPVQTTLGQIIDISEADRLAFDTIGYDLVGATPGDWQGIRIEELAHDANVELIIETELPTGTTNDVPGNSQVLGQLAPNRNNGDSNRRLGFEVHGLIGQPTDVDVYSFTATAGSDIWLDIDRTSAGFDSVLELVAEDGTVIFRSDNSLAEGAFTTNDLYTTNELDAGMQITLPGASGQTGTYHVRVRSGSSDLDDVSAGLTEGRYELQVRMRATDEVPGTSVEFADIRFAKTGIKIVGPPVQSPLLGERAEDESLNDAIYERTIQVVDDMGMVQEGQDAVHTSLPFDVRAQDVGNLLATRNGAISIFGNLESPNFVGQGDVDWYRFTVDYSGLAQSSRNANDEVDVVFDIDYADGLNRADTVISVYNASGELIFFSDSSNVELDQPAAGQGNDLDDLSRGSVSQRDPFIGPVTLETGRRSTSDFDVEQFPTTSTYYVAVSSIIHVPNEIADGSAGRTPVLDDIYETADLSTAPRRGEIISGAAGITTHTDNPNAPDQAIIEGEYQLEIRTAPTPDGGFFVDNTAFADANRERVQGHLNISSNFITDSQEWGVSIEDGLRDLPFYTPKPDDSNGLRNEFVSGRNGFLRQRHTQFTEGRFTPHTGATRALPNINEERIVPGITVANNVISGGYEGGIQSHGDPNGIILSTFDLPFHFDLFNDFDLSDVDSAEFTIWDHQRNSASFQFTSTGATKPGHIPIRINATAEDDVQRAGDELFLSAVGPATFATTIADEIEHAIRRSDLDVKVYRAPEQLFSAPAQEIFVGSVFSGEPGTRFDSVNSMFIEGAIEIGQTDTIVGDFLSPYFIINGDSPLPIITSEIAQQGAVPYAAITNNTIVGRGGNLLNDNQIGDVGIAVEDNSSPTILNNIVSNFKTGILADLSSTDQPIDRRTFIGGDAIAQEDFTGLSNFANFSIPSDALMDPITLYDLGRFGFNFFRDFGADSKLAHRDIDTGETDYIGQRPTVVGASVYSGNLTDTVRIKRPGSSDNDDRTSFVISTTDPLFVDPANGNFFLAESSRAINSSFDFFTERSELTEVQSAVGITSTGVVSPAADALGILRIDDPRVEPPDGFGNNVFKDRGALERADFIGPRAELVAPLDNDPADQDPNLNSVALFDTSLPNFQIQLSDGATPANPLFGSGIDDTSVTGAAITILRDSVELVQEVDYFVTYDATSELLLLTPVAGLWPSGFEYVVKLDNTLIRDRSDNGLQANRSDGTTQFTIQTSEALDYGDAPAPYPTLREDDGAGHRDEGSLRLGASRNLEANGQPNATATGDDFDDGVEIGTSLLRDRFIDVTVTASATGFLDAWLDLNADGDWSDPGEQIFASRSVAAGTNDLTFFLPSTATSGDTFARFRVSSAGGLAPTGIAADGEVEDYAITVTTPVWQNPVSRFDVNGVGGPEPTPLDINNIVTELNRRRYSDPITGQLGDPPTIPPPFYYDVNGNGFATPLDALQAINRLNANLSNLTAPPSGVIDTQPLDDDQPAPIAPLSSGTVVVQQPLLDTSVLPVVRESLEEDDFAARRRSEARREPVDVLGDAIEDFASDVSRIWNLDN